MKRHRVFYAAIGATVLFAASGAAAQDFPQDPIRIIVPSSPGGSLDLTTRLVAEKMGEALGQSVIVENRAGGDTLIGTRMVKAAKPDGYTLLAQANGFSVQPVLKQDPGYDPLRDFAGIGFMTRSPMVMEVGASEPDRSVQDFIDRARGGEEVAYASSGLGGPPHLAAALFLNEVGLDVQHVPYKGNGAALPDVIGGRVDMIFDGYLSSASFLDSGELRPLAVTSVERIAPLPDVPTFKELGIDYAYTLWLGLLAPAGTPQDVVGRLSDALHSATSDPELAARFRSEGSDPTPVSPEEFDAFLAKEVDEMADFMNQLDIARQ